MRTVFSDSQDKTLVQLASVYERRGVRITWQDVHTRMRRSRHSLTDFPNPSAQTLQIFIKVFSPRPAAHPCPQYPSLKTLRGLLNLHTTPLPGGPVASPIPQAAKDVSEVETLLGDLESFGGDEKSSQQSTPIFSTQGLQVADSSERLPKVLVSCDDVPLGADMVMQSVEDLFASVGKQDVRQKPGKRYLNAGELLPAGVDKRVKTLGDVKTADRFLDIGCGLGNATTPAGGRLGIEIRPDIFRCGWRLTQKSVKHRRHLKKVTLICGDASNLCLASEQPFSTATIVLVIHRLFEYAAKLTIEEQLGIHCPARIVIFGKCVP
ncbi:hypothetical protein GN244_ATG02350 [Phytophthora infestans]|uniref:DOT1 domain-containing protein n=1 Tax=Phytophthora infestans TaxID=4787 RepID=A0A833WPG2_PHYIN|nr:hypothetical protein GN244_ATG02350 [Phytophthora infestans]